MSKKLMLSAVAAASAIAPIAIVAGCGDSSSSSSSDTPSNLQIMASEKGKTTVLDVPRQYDGGLTQINFLNRGKAPHDAQFVLVEGNHSVDEVLKIISANDAKIPDWLRAEGGANLTAPGKTSSTTIDLPEGQYYVIDDSSDSGKPVAAGMKVGDGDSGDLPSTDASITADEVSKDKYQWQISGLKSGINKFTFKAKGKQALHHVILAPLKKDLSAQQLVTALKAQKQPPFDFKKVQQTAVLDGGRDLVTSVDLKPGKYALVCFLTDRDGGKPHYEEGLAKVVTIQ